MIRKLASMKIKKDSLSMGDLKDQKMSVVSSRRKKILFLFMALILILTTYFLGRYEDSKKVEIARISVEAVTAGDIVTKEVVSPVKISKEEFERDGIMEVDTPNGKKRQQTIVLWKDIDSYKEHYFNYYMQKNTNFTMQCSSAEMQFKNPLLETMPLGNELYSLPIDASGININQLLPSTTLRVRIAQQVPSTLVPEVEEAMAQKTVYDGSSVIRSILLKHGVKSTASGTAQVVDGGGFTESAAGVASAIGGEVTMVTMSEIIFDEIVAVDMSNSSRESIYEIYMSLMTMPLEERVPYLKTQFENDVSGQFRNRVTPTTLELDLTSKEASNMHIYENEGYNVKYTIIKKDTTNNTLKEFMAINNQLLTQMKAAQGGTP